MAPKKKTQRIIREPETAPAMLSERTAEYLCAGVILIAASVLILASLGNIYLWQDEAQTALVAKTVLHHGIPVGFDGTNSFSQALGAEYTKSYVWIWHPWFPFYLLAGFFAVFGTSTFTARLPFALMGIGTVMLVYYYGKSLWGTRRAGFLAALVLLLNVPFFLLVRQCRYYSPSIFFSVAGLYAYSEMLKGRKYAPTAFGISAFLLFHTHYVYCAALLATAIIHSLIFRGDRIKPVLITSAIVTAVCLPWIMLFSGMGQSLEGFGSLSSRISTNLSRFLVQIVRYIFPWVMLVLAVLMASRGLYIRRAPTLKSQAAQNLALLILFAAITLGAACVTGQAAFFRYLGPLIPVFCLISGLLIESGMRTHWLVGVVALGLLVYRAGMPDYLYEITHDYDGPIEGIVTYLNKHAGPNDVVAVNHEDLPLKFYTGLRVVSGMTGEDISAAKDAKWLVLRKFCVAGDELEYDGRLREIVPMSKFQRITLPYPDILFENREGPDRHLYRTVEGEDPVAIYRRIEE